MPVMVLPWDGSSAGGRVMNTTPFTSGCSMEKVDEEEEELSPVSPRSWEKRTGTMGPNAMDFYRVP